MLSLAGRRRAARDRGRRRRAAARRDGQRTARSSATSACASGWPVLAETFSLVASPRVRNQATVGGVLADADYASDPPAVLQALGRAGRPALDARRARRVRRGADPRLLRDLHRARRAAGRGARAGGARAGGVPQVPLALERGPAVRRRRRGPHRRTSCASWSAPSPRPRSTTPTSARSRAAAPLDAALATEIGRRYAERIEPIDDARGSAGYRRRVTAVEVRRAIEALAA